MFIDMNEIHEYMLDEQQADVNLSEMPEDIAYAAYEEADGDLVLAAEIGERMMDATAKPMSMEAQDGIAASLFFAAE